MNPVTQENSRKFRIRFQSTTTQPAPSVAEECARHLSRYFPMHDADGQGQDDNHQPPPPCNITLHQLADAILNPQRSQWPSSNLKHILYNYTHIVFLTILLRLDYADTGTVPEVVPDLVRSCLMDPTFPALVKAVEDSMKKLMSPEFN